MTFSQSRFRRRHARRVAVPPARRLGVDLPTGLCSTLCFGLSIDFRYFCRLCLARRARCGARQASPCEADAAGRHLLHDHLASPAVDAPVPAFLHKLRTTNDSVWQSWYRRGFSIQNIESLLVVLRDADAVSRRPQAVREPTTSAAIHAGAHEKRINRVPDVSGEHPPLTAKCPASKSYDKRFCLCAVGSVQDSISVSNRSQPHSSTFQLILSCLCQ
jgi:hypothetical protein